jgi:hypothetical protein
MTNIEIIGGPFLVDTNKYGGITTEYGWVKLKIIENNTVYIICENNGKNIILDEFILNIPITIETYERISLHLKNGFGSKYSYNFSKKTNFIKNCKENIKLLIEKNY